MENGAYYGIDFGTTNTSVYLYNYEKGVGKRETRFSFSLASSSGRTTFSSNRVPEK